MKTGRGGPRAGAGRKPGRRSGVPHRRRERCLRSTPALVTVRVLDGIPSLRRRDVIEALRTTFAAACSRDRFRLVHYTIQRDHLHLIVEARGHDALGNGMKSIASRVAKAVNRALSRKGRVLAGRYHVRWLRSPRQVWNALRYVLLNVRKHFLTERRQAPPVQMDAASSAVWFEGWKWRPPGRAREGPRETAEAATWLLRVGWQRYGQIDPADVPSR